jgi:hypothetical protein
VSDVRVAMSEVSDAVELVDFALRKRLVAEADEDYRRLRDVYRDDPRFKQLVDLVADRLGLRVLGVSTFGLAVTPVDGSLFAARTSDYQTSMSVELRVLHGLAHLGVAAYCFPTTGALSDSRVVSIDPAKVSDELTETAKRMAADSPEEVSVDSEELREAWRAWLALPAVAPGKNGERPRQSRLWFVQHTLSWLTEQHMLVHDGTVWRTTDTYRVHVRDIASDVRFGLVRSYVEKDVDEPRAVVAGGSVEVAS